jgi:hypothetical protein
VIGPLLFLLQQGPDVHYAGGASSKIAGTTSLGGHFFRFLFTTVPQWVQLAGILIGVPVAAIIAWQMWKHRRAIWAWWLLRSRGVKTAIVTAVLVVGSGALFSGLYGYNYVMHENDFCQSCHVMDTAWNRFQVSAHKDLQCHACHRQPMYVSTKELFWWVLERRMAVPPHDKVPTAVCSECHMRKGTDSTRTLVTLTAGHAVHLQSDSASLKNVQCVTCHGHDFHVFKPTNASCTSSGCHATTRVNLGTMSSRGFPHCTACHDFRTRVKAGVTVAQARLGLVPNSLNCLKCHQMTQEIKRFDLAADPHKGNCGMCHDAHKQTEPKDAFKTCASAGCHANADTLTAFHRGLGKHAIDQCGACHQAHSWKVRGTNCIACHPTINQDRPAARRISSIARPEVIRRSMARRSSLRELVHFSSWIPTAAPSTSRPAVRDTAFLHSRHTSVACTQCHSTTSSHGGLTFSRPEGCNACHHSTQQKVTCTNCHATSSLNQRSMPVSFAITARRDPVTRPITFAHERHSKLACTRCHTNGVTRPVTTTCSGCHTDHHVATTNCAGCHPTARAGHDRASHAGCAGCHTDATVAALPASRGVCLACHQEQRAHYPTGDCATCHALDHGMMKAVRAGNGR